MTALIFSWNFDALFAPLQFSKFLFSAAGDTKKTSITSLEITQNIPKRSKICFGGNSQGLPHISICDTQSHCHIRLRSEDFLLIFHYSRFAPLYVVHWWLPIVREMNIILSSVSGLRSICSVSFYCGRYFHGRFGDSTSYMDSSLVSPKELIFHIFKTVFSGHPGH